MATVHYEETRKGKAEEVETFEEVYRIYSQQVASQDMDYK